MNRKEAKAKRLEWAQNRFHIHSEGWKPKTSNDIRIQMSKGATDIKELVKPCLERSYDKYQRGKFKELTSTYMGGQIVIVTWEEAGWINQWACTKAEIPSLPEEMRTVLEANLKRCTPGSGFITTMDTYMG